MTVESLPSLPVRLPLRYSVQTQDLVLQGMREYRGLLRAEADALLLELVPHGTLGPGDLTTHRIALADVSGVTFHTGPFRTRLALRPRRLAAFEGLPITADTLALGIGRRDREMASRWATALSLALLDWEAD